MNGFKQKCFPRKLHGRQFMSFIDNIKLRRLIQKKSSQPSSNLYKVHKRSASVHLILLHNRNKTISKQELAMKFR